MRWTVIIPALVGLLCATLPSYAGEPLPFNHKVETYREYRPREGDVLCFAVRLEQPFLAEEFEKSNFLRLQALDRNAYLIYPKETKFQQKHAEFYGRLRGDGKARLRLSYEIVTENLDGSRKVETRQGDIEVAIPVEAAGPQSIYQEWARQQNQHFLSLLKYYPDETFFQYLLLQSKDRYGVTPPELVKPAPDKAALDTSLYDVLTGSLAVQELLQRQTLAGGASTGDLDTPLSQLSPPRLRSLEYAKLLEEKQTKHGVQPKVHEMAKLVPEDQYFLHFNSMRSAGELFDLTKDWGDSLLRLITLHARDNRLQEKLEDQLCVRRGPLTRLFADGVIAELAVTGSDPFVLEGTDVTLLFRLKQPDLFQKAAEGWLAEVRDKRPDLVEREFNYRGHRIAARYTSDRLVSSFVARHEEYAIYSNSHAAIRRIVDAAAGQTPRLHDAVDYRYVATILPPADDENSGYLFVSEAFIRRLVGPQAKIAEKRRLQCFNHLVMLNNASLFYRLEHGKSPESLTSLIEGRFVDPAKVICPHGGAYAWDTRHDACTCSLHNRLKYLTPNAELSVLKVSKGEVEEYNRYKQSYQAFWQTVFDPVAVRITVAPRVKLEVCVLPFANGSLYQDVRRMVAEKPQSIDTSRIAPSAVASLVAVRGRNNVAQFVRQIPGLPEALDADPTLAELDWLGDRVAFHLCDGGTILEIDPTRLHELKLPLVGTIPLQQQLFASLALTATQLPVYVAIDVEDRDKAARLLEQLSAKIFLQGGSFLTLPTALDAYRLPDYKNHALYVVSFKLYAVKVRLHVALVGWQLVAATKPELLKEVIDVAGAVGINPAARQPKEAARAGQEAAPAHVLLRLNRRALGRLHDDLQLHWAEKSRLACHRNAISMYNLLKLYEVPIEQVPRLAEAKYGVRCFCPDHGTYQYDPKRDQVECSVHGNRQRSRQNLRLDQKSSFAEFVDSLDEVIVRMRFQEDALLTTIEITRRQPAGK